MELVSHYEAYTNLIRTYMCFIEELVNTDFTAYTSEVIEKELVSVRDQVQELMDVCETIEVEKEQEENLKDLRYLVMDALFFTTELATFYKSEELGRFKMRAINYLNKRRRAEMFGDDHKGSCRVM